MYGLGKDGVVPSDEIMDAFVRDVERHGHKPGRFSGGLRTMTDSSRVYVPFSCIVTNAFVMLKLNVFKGRFVVNLAKQA